MPSNLSEAYQEILGHVQDGSISETRLQESVLRILTVKFKRGILTEEDLELLSAPTEAPTPTPTPEITADPKPKKTKGAAKKGKTSQE